MANFIAVIDPDIKRRTGFIKNIKPHLPIVEKLLIDTCSSGDFSCIWAAGPQAPVSKTTDEKGAAVIWGDAISQTNADRIDAEQLKNLWNSRPGCSKAVFNGFYAAVVYKPNLGLIAGTDLLGVFPLYYWSNGNILLAGSSPELFRYHPAFQIKFNPAGLVGILLTMHMFDGHTLLAGVKRLSAGHLLLWKPQTTPTELLQYKPAASERYFSLPFSAHLDILDKAVDETISRHIPANGDYSLLLSGGLDSRILAGYLNEKGIRPESLTLGKPTDIEMRYARRVAKNLGLRHNAADVTFDEYPRCAELQTRWEHISNGFNFIMNWGINPHLINSAHRVITGHIFDAVIGSSYITWAYSPSQAAMSFEPYFANINRWGIRPQILKKLLRKDIFGDLIDETITRIKTVYESYSQLESQRAWCFNLYHRQRFHVGSAAWALSFGAWPVIPAIDQALLESAAAMPASTIAERRAETELLCKRFPKLAALPIDRNCYYTEPLRPRLRYQVIRYFHNQLKALWILRGVGKNSKIERRYYFRIYDFNNPGWRAVRKQAEPYRQKLFSLFHKDVLAEMLPAPEAPVRFENNIVEASGLKSLLGFMLWSKDYL